MGRRLATITTVETDRQARRERERERERECSMHAFSTKLGARDIPVTKKMVHDTDTSQIITINSVRYR